MNEPPFKRTLRHLAEDAFPPRTDLWPSIEQQLERANLYKRIKMPARFLNFSRNIAFGAVLILLGLGLVWMLSNSGIQPAIVSTQTMTPEIHLPVSTESPITIPTATATFPSQNSTLGVYTQFFHYSVQEGDLCMSIALAFNVSVQDIINSNGLDTNCSIIPGQTLLIPQPTPTPDLRYERLRDSGIAKILAGDLEGGLSDLDQAQRIRGPLDLDGDVSYYHDMASKYLIGLSFWDVDWEEAVYYFGNVAHYEPDLHDSTGLTAANRYETALETYIPQLMAKEDWCAARKYQQKWEAFNPDKKNETDFQTTSAELDRQCGIQRPPVISLESDSETIRQSMIDSPTNWSTIFVDASVTKLNGNSPQTYVRLWFVAPDKGRTMYDFDGNNLVDSFVFINNTIQTTFDLQQGTKETQILDDIPAPSLSILNPGAAFALNGSQSSGGTFRPIRTDSIAGRETLIVEWTDDDGKLRDRIWIDIYTGVVLKWQNLREGYISEIDGPEYLMNVEIEVVEIIYDERYQNFLFDPSVPNEPIYMYYPYTPTDSEAVFIPTPGVPDTSLEYGEIYLLTADGQTEMLHFPASCLVSGKSCPQPEFITDVPVGTVYPPFNWSPDQTQMITNGSASHVLVFRRESQDWSQFYYAPYFNFPVWSPDGQWLAGGIERQAAITTNHLILVSANGRDWQETMTDYPGIKYPLGWLDNDHILIQNSLDSQREANDGTVYDEIQVYNFQTGEMRVITGIQLDGNLFTLTTPALSPDRMQLAYTMVNKLEGTSEVTIIQLEDGKVSSFPFASGIATWSPDGQWLSLQTFQDNRCEIHLVHPDGTDAYKVFSGTGCNFTWSPDSQYILVPAMAQSPNQPRLYVINVSSGETRLIELPDVGTEFWWPVASWVP